MALVTKMTTNQGPRTYISVRSPSWFGSVKQTAAITTETVIGEWEAFACFAYQLFQVTVAFVTVLSTTV